MSNEEMRLGFERIARQLLIREGRLQLWDMTQEEVDRQFDDLMDDVAIRCEPDDDQAILDGSAD